MYSSQTKIVNKYKYIMIIIECYIIIRLTLFSSKYMPLLLLYLFQLFWLFFARVICCQYCYKLLRYVHNIYVVYIYRHNEKLYAKYAKYAKYHSNIDGSSDRFTLKLSIIVSATRVANFVMITQKEDHKQKYHQIARRSQS